MRYNVLQRKISVPRLIILLKNIALLVLHLASKQEDSSVVYFRMFFSNGIMKIKESISISLDLKVTLSFEGIPIPLPEWLRIAKNCKITRISQLQNLPSYIQNKTEELPPNEILDEIKSLTFLKPQGRPPFSPRVLRYSLLLRYSSRQAYSLLLNEFPLPSFSLLEKVVDRLML